MTHPDHHEPATDPAPFDHHRGPDLDDRAERYESAVELLQLLGQSATGDAGGDADGDADGDANGDPSASDGDGFPQELAEFASMLLQLDRLQRDLGDAVQGDDSGDGDTPADVQEFVLAAAETVKQAVRQSPPNLSPLEEVRRNLLERWGDRLGDSSATGPLADAEDDWAYGTTDGESPDDPAGDEGYRDDLGQEPGADDHHPVSPSAEEIARLLAGLGAGTGQPGTTGEGPGEGQTFASGQTFGSGQTSDSGQTSASPGRSESHPTATDADPAPPIGEETVAALEADPQPEGELRDAFLDDADRCLGAIEDALLTLEAAPESLSPLREILRELHTLKGASGSVGLSGLAHFIHQLEDSLRESETAQHPPDVDSLLKSVDTIRRRVDQIRSPGPAPADRDPALADRDRSADSREAAATPAGMNDDRAPSFAPVRPETLAAASPTAAGGFSALGRTGAGATRSASQDRAAGGLASGARATETRSTGVRVEETGDEETVRVRTSQLNRLMDLLSELVMLRNRRGMELSELESIHHQLVHGVSRMRVIGDEAGVGRGDRRAPAETPSDAARQMPRLTEITNDLFDTAQRLRGCFRPVAEGNAAVSQFIRQFRQELVELRRAPASGLFRRMKRAVRDACRVEAKQVELAWAGEETGIERSLQEKLYEPLLHIVRNCIGHGIETPAERVSAGKTAAGHVRLTAHGGPDLLVIEIRDDGRGLDYEAIRRRGTERGLLAPGAIPSREELAQLIFQPGFSTRETSNELAGRGVGMDVVANTLDRLRGWIQVESEPGQGTAIRLHVPLPSAIQHVMLFRDGGQLFALPMQFVSGADAGADAEALRPRNLADRLGNPVRPDPEAVDRDRAPKRPALPTQVLLLDGGFNGDTGGQHPARKPLRLALRVDEILGPEEVVVRPLPALLKSHPVCTGATLSGMGETVLVLDPHAVAAGAGRSRITAPDAAEPNPQRNTLRRPQILVTDDSVTARQRLVQSLQRYDVEITEAANGAEALERLRHQSFAAVFSDLEMPGVDGLELLAQIKGDGRTREIPVVIVSSRTEDEFRGRARELGVSEYLGKPIDDETLDRALAEVPALREAILQPGPTQDIHPRHGETR